MGKSLKDFQSMPLLDLENHARTTNLLMQEELAYDMNVMTEENDKLVQQLTEEQSAIYDIVLQDAENNLGGLFFVYGYGGTGKTFLWRALSSALRSKGEIVLNVASSGIASLLLLGGRTAHSRFAIPIAVNEDSTCNISQGSHLAQLIMQSKLIIWDEAPMMHKFCFEALDRAKNPKNLDMTFGGKTVVLGGDFRQILPVIPKGTRQDIVGACINASYLWRSCKVFRLTKNLRLRSLQSDTEVKEIEEFAKWIANIGDGTIGDSLHGECEINIPEEFVLTCVEDPISTIVDSIFPMFRRGHSDIQYLKDRAILAPTLDIVDAVNEYMNDYNNAEGRTYLDCDSVKSDSNVDMLADLHTPEFLNGLRCSGVPNHSLTLKVGSPVMLLRNIDHSLGLCNGTRMIISKLVDHVLEAQILCGASAGTKVLIPRMPLTPSDPRLPFKFQRKQFPLMLSYAMTINKSQGQTLSNVGLFFKRTVFNHGQMYVAVSRVSNPKGLKILIWDENVKSKNTTTNVVYKEVFNNV
ncbi:PREDICTED: ATP-dependent DNA helicase PIF1-like [Ipomoea nil]|uniref:ATP-dependent DNA helicase PIF1-like n=1 Tax=Ipomoea nil TaxID=35883 RepID=UPI0009009771|nr:PREDICTED: ATP-dependent DNA helicase PIF1-like [Ipomoea nil]